MSRSVAWWQSAIEWCFIWANQMELKALKEELLIPALAALAVAVIAGVVSLVVSILSKDQKTSEFRQAWIDGLRTDVSQLLAHFPVVMRTASIVNGMSKQDRNEFFISHQRDHIEMEALSLRIKLRLNPNEHRELVALLDADDEGELTDDQLEQRAKDICAQTQLILKSEWERVKRGENSFVWLKRISKALSTLAVIAALCSGWVFIEDLINTSTQAASCGLTDCSQAPTDS